MSTPVSYVGKVPPLMREAIRYVINPEFHGSGGSGPVVPVPYGSVLQNGTVGVAYSETLSASGGTSPYTYAVTSGSLPPGTSLNSSTGVISGTPTTPGSYTFTVQATDANGAFGSTSLTITVAAASAGGFSFTWAS